MIDILHNEEISERFVQWNKHYAIVTTYQILDSFDTYCIDIEASYC